MNEEKKICTRIRGLLSFFDANEEGNHYSDADRQETQNAADNTDSGQAGTAFLLWLPKRRGRVGLPGCLRNRSTRRGSAESRTESGHWIDVVSFHPYHFICHNPIYLTHLSSNHD